MSMWRVMPGVMLALILTSLPVTARSETTETAAPTAPAVSSDYRRGFLDGWRAAHVHQERKHADRGRWQWRDRRAGPGDGPRAHDRLRPPRSGTAPYWRNRPRPWVPPETFAERRWKRGQGGLDGATRLRTDRTTIIETSSQGVNDLRPPQ